jgi:hypothetical protein
VFWAVGFPSADAFDLLFDFPQGTDWQLGSLHSIEEIMAAWVDGDTALSGDNVN